MKRSENIYLIGLMGAGKTTIGRQLASALRLPFYDSDRAIVENTGVDIPTIFEYEGEEGFRNREQAMIAQLTEIEGIVLATGGGAVLRENNRKQLQSNGFVVYLQCSIEHILQRTRRDPQRPLLNTEDPKQQLQTLFKEREPLYLGCADFKIDTGEIQSRLVVKNILQAYQQFNDYPVMP
jgi:shikimate kinase